MPTKAEALAELARRGVKLPQAEIKLTEDQGKSQDYARQMATAEQQYLNARQKGYNPTSGRNALASFAEDFKLPLVGQPLNALAPLIRDDASDQGVAAERAWRDSRLKAMTGAGQSAQEAGENEKTYFPRFGEGGTYEPKYNIRREAYRSTKNRAGPAGADLPAEYPNPARMPKAGPPSGPVKVNSPQEAAKLAPGTVFITPDGRRKVR